MKKLNLVLLIDDNEADNEFHEIVIRHADITSRLKSIDSSRDALKYLKNSFELEDNSEYPTPELIFLDINMPAMNGFELLEEVREIPDPYKRKKAIKIFMLTSSINPNDRTVAEERHSDLVTGFRVKPLTDVVFLDIVQRNF